MMIFSLVAMIGLDKCCITSACLQWLCHSGERIVARGPLVSFLDDNFSKNQWIFTKPGVCIDIVDICFWIANGRISSIFDSYLPACNTSVFYFQHNNFRKFQWIFTKFDVCIDIVEICFGIAHRQICLSMTR